MKELNVTHDNASFFSQSTKSPPKYVYCHISQRKAWYLDMIVSQITCWLVFFWLTEFIDQIDLKAPYQTLTSAV